MMRVGGWIVWETNDSTNEGERLGSFCFYIKQLKPQSGDHW